MSVPQQDLEILARAVLDRLEAVEPPCVRRLLLAQLNVVAKLLQLEASGADELAAETGVVALVEECRDGRLRELDADRGLGTLGIEWQEVVLRVAHRLAQDRRAATCRCSRCGASTYEVTHRGGRRRPPGRHFRRIGTGDLYRARRCSACGLVQPPHGR